MDSIIIKDLSVYAYHGFLPEERKLGQNFYISAELFVDLRSAGMHDDISQTVNYAAVCGFINEYTRVHPAKLIETAAEQLAEQILLSFPAIEEVSLSIKKPSAPIGLPLQYVSVKINRKWHEAFIAFGSNIGNREGYINYAIEELRHVVRIKLEAVSPFYASTPYGGVEQSNFINGALRLSTLLLPFELLDLLQKIERGAKRKRDIHWGPRTLDLDILLYDDEIINNDKLILPHPDMANRDFVMKPMAQLVPQKLHPVLNKSMQALYDAIPHDQLHIYRS
ncbi:2-amino-4-hydroxy-6-hydroxymethyldihydropteridine diphosphokinase [Pectinatus haikarae]|uniref:Bifunctional folate synthesis protein n=1 Tax=Pectinatus haikarae TaxID=349096 RepID=A0ABT9Y7B9_9FIRM|nr:2-amino-4-hydroxy-6-hydroxymethyldihydropteridine diphosphokinase [Pectinatus haikarae]MDQ0203723.1 dihydroneopterin aldolase/2-amino-4-hydroxy-6-hydroxymethyldihydropteridine diphosphokinase [Pectinatus haikarae]